MSMQLVIGPEAINSYHRLSYTPWHAIAEFVDNSTQSYFDNQAILDQQLQRDGESFEVSIVYEPDVQGGLLRVVDNAMGMSREELERALHIANPPSNLSGRSRYGMGMKTAAFWIGRKWSIQTKQLGEATGHQVTVDIDRIAQQRDTTLDERLILNQDPNTHYTIVEVWDHYRRFHGRTLGKIAEFLRSMYRRDITAERLRLLWRGQTLTWEGFDHRLMTASDGSLYKKKLWFDLNGKGVTGWVGILKQGEGGRTEAGFSILQSDRVILASPEAWRPTTIYGPFGTNDLINQRLVGELHLDGFEVSHTKDSIQWRGDEEEQMEKKLKEAVGDYRTIAGKSRKGGGDQRGPSEVDIKVAVAELEKELEAPEMVDQINLSMSVVPPQEALIASREKVIRSVVQTRTPTLQRIIQTTPPLAVKLFLGDDLSDRDAYVYQEATKPSEIIVTVNQNHPFWTSQLRGPDAVLEFLRQCIYDALAEWQAGTRISRVDPDTIKWLKDGFLRLPMEIERHIAEEQSASEATA
ncbi:MAG TPA: ATP-binding protein [Thermoanaerobaculia bacterium]|nr:ATP-binding protein [Thermoanaerobaculia bacterium]